MAKDESCQAEYQQLKAGIHNLGLVVEADQQKLLMDYLQLLNKWNRAFNLSGIRTISDMVDLHLLDSLSVSPYLQGRVILDIGSGAGLPGIPLAITHPEKQFILLDSNGKKTRFLFQVKLALGLDNVEVENNRIEHYQSEGQIDIVTCRAFSSLANTVHLCRRFLAAGARLLAMKGRFLEQELTLPTEKLSGRQTPLPCP